LRLLVDIVALEQVVQVTLIIIIPPLLILIYGHPLRCAVALTTQHINTSLGASSVTWLVTKEVYEAVINDKRKFSLLCVDSLPY
jgi:hypothetical protein